MCASLKCLEFWLVMIPKYAFIFWKWSNLKPLNCVWHLAQYMDSCFWSAARHVLFCKTTPNDSIQSHLQTCLVLIPQKVALQRDPFWRGEHKTRNVIPSQQKKWKAKRVASFSVRTLATVFLLHTPDDPLTWCLLLEQLVRLSRHFMHSTPFNRATLAALRENPEQGQGKDIEGAQGIPL